MNDQFNGWVGRVLFLVGIEKLAQFLDEFLVQIVNFLISWLEIFSNFNGCPNDCCDWMTTRENSVRVLEKSAAVDNWNHSSDEIFDEFLAGANE